MLKYKSCVFERIIIITKSYCLLPHARPSARMYQCVFQWMNFSEILYWGLSLSCFERNLNLLTIAPKISGIILKCLSTFYCCQPHQIVKVLSSGIVLDC